MAFWDLYSRSLAEVVLDTVGFEPRWQASKEKDELLSQLRLAEDEQRRLSLKALDVGAPKGVVSRGLLRPSRSSRASSTSGTSRFRADFEGFKPDVVAFCRCRS